MNDTSKSLLAELIGTFTFVFIGAGASALSGAGVGETGIGVVGVAFAHGLAVMTSIYAWGAVSGCHINPAVTFGLMTAGKISVPKAVLYWAAQIGGGILAALLLKYLIGIDGKLGSTEGALTDADPLKAVIVEGILTFFLVAAVFGSAVSGRNGNAVGLAIGLVVTMDILVGANLTGASMNPARTLGPAVGMGDFHYLWIYIVGPFAGAALASMAYLAVMRGEEIPVDPKSGRPFPAGAEKK